MLYSVRQRFETGKIENLQKHVCSELEKIGQRITPGASIALAVGSRGIAHIGCIVRATVGWLARKRAKPFIVPAMGSHGGATAEGQEQILASYGITEAEVGAPVRSNMEVVEMSSALGIPLYMDKLAYKADGILLINRIKPHTDFHGSYESGLVKMSVIGLGKHAQALAIHSHGVYGLKNLIPRCAEIILRTGKIIAGLGIIENACDEPALIRAIPAEELLAEEPQLLERARKMMPSLPVEDLDLLIIDQMGKDISGAGIDTWTIGRLLIRGEPEPQRPKIKSILVRDLTASSQGNAIGVGLADVITRRLFEKIDLKVTYANVYTSNFPARAKIPMITETDAEGIDVCLRSCGPVTMQELRIVRILDTLHLGHMYVSDKVRESLRDLNRVQIESTAIELLDRQGDCPQAFWG